MNFTEEQLDELSYSDEYMEYIMANGDRMCCNGDMLIELAEDGYLFEEFLESIRDNIRSV